MRRSLRADLAELPGLTWEKVGAGRRVVEARRDVTDPLVYLFGVLRAMRAERRLSKAEPQQSGKDVVTSNLSPKGFRRRYHACLGDRLSHEALSVVCLGDSRRR